MKTYFCLQNSDSLLYKFITEKNKLYSCSRPCNIALLPESFLQHMAIQLFLLILYRVCRFHEFELEISSSS